MTFDPGNNCPHCGGALLTWDQLLALAAIASTSKAAGAPRLADDAEAEARRRRPVTNPADEGIPLREEGEAAWPI